MPQRRRPHDRKFIRDGDRAATGPLGAAPTVDCENSAYSPFGVTSPRKPEILLRATKSLIRKGITGVGVDDNDFSIWTFCNDLKQLARTMPNNPVV